MANNNISQKIFSPSARGRLWRTFVILILLVIVASMVDGGRYYNRGAGYLDTKTHGVIKLPRTKEIPFRLGLDLQGGTHLVYQADVSKVPESEKMSAVEGVRDVIERRVNVFGVSEPVVQTNKSGDSYQVIVELAGIKDVSEAIKMIGETPLLEFKEKGTPVENLTAENKQKIQESVRQAEAKGKNVLGKLMSGGDFAALAKEFSEDDNTKAAGGDLGWVSRSANSEQIALLGNTKTGQTTNLVRSSQGYEIIKLEDKRTKKSPFSNDLEKEAKVAHILICYKGTENCQSDLTKEQAYEKIKKLKAEATVKNFAQLAKENSTEPGAKDSGGDLGWFARGAMVKPFEDAVFSMAKGTISYVVETKFGYHIIYKQDERPVEEYKLRHILFKFLSEKDFAGGKDNWKNTELTGKYLKRAVVQFDPNSGSPQVSLEFNDDGNKLFEQITARNIGQQVAIFLDGYAISAPTVNEKISGGKAVITGSFNVREANLLAQRLNTGALPVPISLVKQQVIGASLGQKSVDDSLKAGLIGFLLVALFMLFYYRLPGLVSIIALAIYSAIVMAVFKLWPVTLTLSGLAGFILSIGIAVDANILIFERIKEELKAGRTLSSAIEEGFKRAWPSIRDGNYSTLITCLVLYIFYTGTLRGFAITLSLGILISIFCAIIVTRNFLRLLDSKWLESKLWLFGVKK